MPRPTPPPPPARARVAVKVGRDAGVAILESARGVSELACACELGVALVGALLLLRGCLVRLVRGLRGHLRRRLARELRRGPVREARGEGDVLLPAIVLLLAMEIELN